MTKHRPVGHFLWVQKTLSEIIEESNDSERGYFVMVDLEYPKSLHDNHNDFPMAAEKQLKIVEAQLSNYRRSLSRPEATAEKLMEILQQNRLCLPLFRFEILC